MLELGNSTVVANIDSERFQTGADKYAAYLETPPGRLRLDLATNKLLTCQEGSGKYLERGNTTELVRWGWVTWGGSGVGWGKG